MKLNNRLLFITFLLFLGAGIVSAWQSFQAEPAEIIAAEIATKVEKQIRQTEQQISVVMDNIDNPSSIDHQKFYPFFIYYKTSLIYWSDNSYVPPAQSVSDNFNIKLLKTGSGTYLALKKQLPDKRYVVSLIMLKRDYIINNDYLGPEWNRSIFPSGNINLHEAFTTAGVPICIDDDNCLFRVAFLTGDYTVEVGSKRIAAAFIIMAIILLVVFVYGWVIASGKKYPERGFFLLVIFFLAVRIAMTEFNFPNVFFHSDLFDPQIFAVSSLNASLGDLLLNIIVVLILCRYLFKYYFNFNLLKYRNHQTISWILMTGAGLCVLFAGLFLFVVVQTLYNNSSITLDISQSLRFDSLRVIALVIVLLSGVSAFLFSHVFIRILVNDKNQVRVIVCFAVAIVVFVFINELTEQQYLSSLLITVFYFAVVYVSRLSRSLKRLSYTTFAYLFIGIFCLALNGAYCIHYFSDKEKIESQFRFANNFLIDRDIFGEYLLHEASQKIASDAFTQTRITSPFLGKEAIAQKIRQYFLPSYFNKYDVEILIFNSAGDPVGRENGPSLSELINRYDRDAYRTEYSGIRFINNPETDVTQKYLITVPIHRYGVIAGYVVVELSLKKIIPENVYPELLVDSRAQQFYRTQDISYAVYSNKRIVFTSGAYNYEKFFDPAWMGITKLYMEGITKNGYDHIAQEDHNDRVAIVSTKEAPFAYRLANFSFLFVLGLLVILMLIFFQGIYNYFRGSRLFFSARIQLYLNLAFFVPLIIVSISTLGLTNRSSQEQLDEEYLNKSRTFGEKITPFLHDYFYEDDVLSFDNELSDLASLSDLDANVYNANGTLLATSQPLIFENHLISTYVSPEAFNKIRSGETNFIESEKVGSLEYFVAYSSLKSPQTGELLGILGIPFFQSAYFMEKVQIVIFTNILNIFAFIFIALLILSYFVSEWLTFPLRFITQSLRKTSLNKTNTPLTWNAADEIGLMVKEYNAMLYKLSESKNQLEQTQREKAWREIAQQVAHEIKNPLTPMKLTLQQLERALQSGSGSEEKSQKAIKMLLSQVDTLNDIASSFSGFAKMPELIIRKLDLVAIVKRAVDLHSSSGDIRLKILVKEAWIFGDEQMLERTFSNLILNGLQSGLPGQSIRIEVQVEKANELFRIMFRDNGKGIDPKIADLVFLPHFSTKKSGSGLGLAIAKQGIEQMKGKIWFESKSDSGTSFFIELPEMNDDVQDL